LASTQIRSGRSASIAACRSGASWAARPTKVLPAEISAPSGVRAFQSSSGIASIRGSIGAAEMPSRSIASTLALVVRKMTS
jgi:hypothetical protein